MKTKKIAHWTIDICEGTKKERQRNNVVVDFRGGLHFFAHIFLYRLDLAQKIIFSIIAIIAKNWRDNFCCTEQYTNTVT